MKLDPRSIEQLREVGGVDLVRQMVDLFFELTPQRLDDMRQGLANSDAEPVVRGAHFLRSSFGNLGATELSALAAETERAGREGRLAETTGLVEKLAAGYSEMEALLRRRLAELESDG